MENKFDKLLTPEEAKNITLEDLFEDGYLDVRAFNALKRAGYRNALDIIGSTKEELEDKTHISKAYETTVNAMGELGLPFSDEVAPLSAYTEIIFNGLNKHPKKPSK